MGRILIYQTAFLGDLLLSIPLIKNIKNLFPKAELHLACRAPLGEIFLAAGLVAFVHEIKKWESGSRKKFEEELLGINWDKIFCPHRATRSYLFMLRLNANERYGFSKWWANWRFTKTVNYDQDQPDALRQLSLLLPISPVLEKQFSTLDRSARRRSLRSVEMPALDLSIPDWASLTLPKLNLENEVWQNWADDVKPLVFISPGSQWKTKQWTSDGFREVALDALKKNCRVIAVGSADERDLIHDLKITSEYFHNLAGETTITQLLALFQRGLWLTSNDSGSMHLAACAELATVAVFGPTILELGYEPWQKKARVVEVGLLCRPCGKHGHDVCPIGTHICMKDISATRVIETLAALPK